MRSARRGRDAWNGSARDADALAAAMMDDPGSRALAYGQRAVDDPAARVTEDRVTGNGPLALARTDDGGGEETPGGGGSTGTSASLPSPWPSKLDAGLKEVTAPHLLRAAVDVVAGTRAFKGMTFALADLSTNGERLYAGSHDNEQRFIASTGKIAILFAAFQLRKAMREAGALLTDKALKQDTQVFDAIMRQWRAKIGHYFHGTKGSNDSLPSLAQIFTGTPLAAGGWNVEFAVQARGGTGRPFNDRLQSAVRNSDDEDAGLCIRDLGFPYINGCLAEAGLRKGGRGLWLALDYAGQFWWPETLADAGSPQAGTARSLVELMTLLEFDELVPGSRSDMLDMLSGLHAGQPIPGAHLVRQRGRSESGQRRGRRSGDDRNSHEGRLHGGRHARRRRHREARLEGGRRALHRRVPQRAP